MGQSWPLFSLVSSFQHLTVKMIILKLCRRLDSNPGSLVLEAIALPTDPQFTELTFTSNLS